MKTPTTVKNPLTIIAVFAGLTEIGGTSVLPFLTENNQSLYILFLMVFPFLLVALFFLTLNFNRQALYAPSDWVDEENFWGRRFEQVPASEGTRKLKEEVEEEEAIAGDTSAKQAGEAEGGSEEADKASVTSFESKPSMTFSTSETLSSLSRQSQSERMMRYHWAEKRALEKLARLTKLGFRRDYRFKFGTGHGMEFDGVYVDRRTVHVAEVKYLSRASSILYTSKKVLELFRSVSASLEKDAKKLVLHLVIVTDEAVSEDAVAKELDRLRRFETGLEFELVLHHFSFQELSLQE